MTPKTCKDCGNPTFGTYPENRCQGCHEDSIRRDTRKQFEKPLGVPDFKRPPKVRKEF